MSTHAPSSKKDPQSLHFIVRSGLAGGVAGCVVRTPHYIQVQNERRGSDPRLFVEDGECVPQRRSTAQCSCSSKVEMGVLRCLERPEPFVLHPMDIRLLNMTLTKLAC